ncbi:MAG: DUF2147 domain-containing protein [Xanthobacteraceae bacterium]|nr:DUF2147 domain-containing protein [Xanthobacteraceae bacterium]
MKKIAYWSITILAFVAPAGAATPVAATGPVGEWVVEDGVARIRIVDCNSHLWGVVSWEKNPGGIDSANPDTSKRTRPTLGIPILLNLTKPPSGNTDQWTGKIYNAENGKTYDAKIRPLSPDKLELKGCVLGFLCGGQTWTRYVDPAAAAPATSLPAPAAGAVKGKAGTAAAKPAPAPDPATEICSLPEIAGTPH